MIDPSPLQRNGATSHPRGFNRLSLRTSLLLVVLVPMLGMGVLAADLAVRSSAQRTVSLRLERDAVALVDLISARTVAADEEVVSAVLALGADLGADAEQMSELYGIDYDAVLAAARTAVDDDPILASRPELADSMSRLRELRPAIDAGTAGFDRVHEVLLGLTSEVDALWRDRFDEQRRDLAADALPARVSIRLDVLEASFQALTAASDRVAFATRVLLSEPDAENTRRLLAATTTYDLAIDSLSTGLGPRAEAAWRAHTAEAGTQRFEATLDQVTTVALTGKPSPLSGDPTAFGDAFIDGQPWAGGHSTVVKAAAADLEEIASRDAADATRNMWMHLATSLMLAALSIAGAVLLARRVAKPVRRLEAAAHQVHQGRFDLPPMATTGPRELADTTAAFNEMTMTLSAVEAHAVALADDSDAPVLSHELPGRTGRALQVALNRLRSSIKMAEQRRQELEEAATHDALTGLLNRAAAAEMIARDLTRLEREGGSVMALFVDLDGLKPINDQHGHAAGDDALRLTADALRSATRSSDVVARVGGDEFLVAGVVDAGADEVAEMAERIRRGVADQVVAVAGGEVPLRCSVGIAIVGPGTTVDTLVHKADAAMYEAKRGGRNRVAWGTEDVASAKAPGCTDSP